MTDNVATDVRLRERVAEELRALLGRRRISHSALAAQLGVSQMYVSRRLNGETAVDMDDLERISQILQITPLDVLRAASTTPTLGEVQPGGPLSSNIRPMSIRPRIGRPPNRDQRTFRTRPPVGQYA